MARSRRVVAVGAPHHVTQRGNARQDVFTDSGLCSVYLGLLSEHAARDGLHVLAYCLMTNHMHLVVLPETEHSLANTFRHTHARFAQYWNTRFQRAGHLWQNRFYSWSGAKAAARGSKSRKRLRCRYGRQKSEATSRLVFTITEGRLWERGRSMMLATYVDFADLWIWLLAWRANSWWGRGEGLRRRIGDLSFQLRPGLRRVVAARFSAALGSHLPDEELRHMTRTLFQNSWLEREIYWFQLLASEPDALSRIRDLVTVDGFEHLREALAAGKGAVVWECPLGNRSLGRLALAAAGFRVTVVHGPCHGGSSSRLGQHVVRRLYRAAEARLPVEVVDIVAHSTAYIVRIMDHLRENGLVCINGFGRLGRRSVALDFLGQTRHFAAGPASLAISTGAALIPAFCYRDSAGRHHLTLERQCPIGGGESIGALQEKVVRSWVGQLEAYVLRYPDQWMGLQDAQ